MNAQQKWGRKRGPVEPPAADTVVATALRLLSRRALSAGELSQRLGQRGYDQAACDAALQAMRTYGYIDDAALAQRCAAEAQRTGRGPGWVRQKLAQRRVQSDLSIPAAQATYASEAEATARGLALLGRRYARHTQTPLAAPDAQRALRFLLRRGFNYACARAAVLQLGCSDGETLPQEM